MMIPIVPFTVNTYFNRAYFEGRWIIMHFCWKQW